MLYGSFCFSTCACLALRELVALRQQKSLPEFRQSHQASSDEPGPSWKCRLTRLAPSRTAPTRNRSKLDGFVQMLDACAYRCFSARAVQCVLPDTYLARLHACSSTAIADRLLEMSLGRQNPISRGDLILWSVPVTGVRRRRVLCKPTYPEKPLLHFTRRQSPFDLPRRSRMAVKLQLAAQRASVLEVCARL